MKKADLSAVKVWRIANAIWTGILLVLLIAVIVVRSLFFSWLPVSVLYGFGALIVLQIIWFIWLEPLIAYRTHQYEIKSTELVIQSGILVKKKTVIPFARIQNVETQVGPIMKRFNLKSVEVTTAGGGVQIELISVAEADRIKKLVDEAVIQLERRTL